MCISSVHMLKICVNKRAALKLMYSCKMKKNNLEVIYLNVACYKQYVDYFKTTFPYTASPIYKEWAINMAIQIDSQS